MDLFSVCGEILNSYRDEICVASATGQQIPHDQFKQGVDSAYFAQGQQANYSEQVQKFGYIRNDVPAHGDLVKAQIIGCVCLERILRVDTTVSIVALGGGPATDIFGILGWLAQARREQQQQRTPLEIEYTCIDRENWEQVCTAHVIPVLQARAGTLNTTLNINFETMDICSAPPLGNTALELFTDVDLVTCVYLFSEIWKRTAAEKEHAAQNLVQFMRNTRPGTLFLFIDIADANSEVRGWLDSIVVRSQIRFNLLCATDKYEHKVDSSQEKTNLGEHFSCDCMPKLGLLYFSRVWQKA